MQGESGVTRTIIDELHSRDIEVDQREDEVVRLGFSLMNFILRISNEIKWKVKVMLLEVSLINFILGISKDIKWKVKAWYYSKYHR